jgi:glycosyltransferase involved in cell wall biosynthesis
MAPSDDPAPPVGAAAPAPAKAGAPHHPRARRRILVLTPRPPFPAVGGDKVRIANLCRELARHHDLTLLSLCTSRGDLVQAEPGIFTQAEYVALPRWRSWLNALAALPTAQPMQLAYYRSAAFQRRVQALLPGHDAVLCHLVRTAPYALNSTCPRILEMTDAISLSMERARAVAPVRFDLRMMLYRVEARRLRDVERTLAARFDLVSLISAVDRDHLFPADDDARRRCIVVPNGVAAPPPLAEPTAATELAFVGNLRTLQNLDAVWFFLRDVLPALRAHHPGLTLRLIGPVGTADRQHLARNDGVRVIGQVDSITTALQGAAIGICPMRIGAGMQNKVLDYMAHGLATVTSPVGLEGIQAIDGEHLLVAGPAEEWVERIGTLVRQPAMARKLGAAARSVVADSYRWGRCASPLLDAIDTLPLAAGR